MEPVYSMSAYVVVLTAALVALAGRGFSGTAIGIALSIAVVAALLWLSYVVRRRGDRVLAHRRRLDRLVLVQWICVGAIGTLGGGVMAAMDTPPLAHPPVEVQAIVVGVAAAAAVVYVSSLIDWYWILPKVSGMVGIAPCERTGGEAFAGVTKVWYFHRAAATTLVTVALVAVPGYIAGEAESGSVSAAWLVFGSALAIGYNSVNGDVTTSFRLAFNPRRFVGDMIRVRDPEEGHLRDAYVVDVSIQGLKYKVPAAGEEKPCFQDKGELLPIGEIPRTNRSRDARQPCPAVADCRAVNWYCFRNPHANVLHGAEVEPVPWKDSLSPPVPE